MRINILQHTPNEGPGSIRTWAEKFGHQIYVYHPYQFLVPALVPNKLLKLWDM
ncbi:hypothetical protein GA0061075_10786 [Weissella hellenica]|uniref:Uncharacterized protein n=1 Tax=Weissella hellenica TaxID=46256 RepID=A0A4Y4G2S2_WEIHE|nr:hypothetical protein [Weissella hellenica]GED35175.1 hypothetical protein WHE01_00790 [Weissella hellenica]SCB94181.1 hypothetical protein GA0061075_10786 [Weissella hellenica]